MFTTGLRDTRTLFGLYLVAAVSAAPRLAGVSSTSTHGGPYELHITPDGAGGISVNGTYAEGYSVESIMGPVATAKCKDGKEAGAIAEPLAFLRRRAVRLAAWLPHRRALASNNNRGLHHGNLDERHDGNDGNGAGSFTGESHGPAAVHQRFPGLLAAAGTRRLGYECPARRD